MTLLGMWVIVALVGAFVIGRVTAPVRDRERIMNQPNVESKKCYFNVELGDMPSRMAMSIWADRCEYSNGKDWERVEFLLGDDICHVVSISAYNGHPMTVVARQPCGKPIEFDLRGTKECSGKERGV